MQGLPPVVWNACGGACCSAKDCKTAGWCTPWSFFLPPFVSFSLSESFLLGDVMALAAGSP
jgi:hypothetical protein